MPLFRVFVRDPKTDLKEIVLVVAEEPRDAVRHVKEVKFAGRDVIVQKCKVDRRK